MSEEPALQRLKCAIENKASGVRSLRGAWESGVERLRSAGAGVDDCLALLESFQRPSSLLVLARCWKLDPAGERGLLDRLTPMVDESAYALVDWLAALEGVLEYLESERRQSALGTLLGYLECSAALAGSQPSTPRLPEVVAEMLDQYGFEG